MRVAVCRGLREIRGEPVTVAEAVVVLVIAVDLEPVADTVEVREAAADRVVVLDTAAERVRMLAVSEGV